MWFENVGLRAEKKKLKNKRVQGIGCNMQIMQLWDAVSSDLLSVTLGHVALGYKEATAPGSANPLPWWSSVDFREVFKCAQKSPCQEPPIRLEPWEPASSLDLSPQVSLALWDSQL